MTHTVYGQFPTAIHDVKHYNPGLPLICDLGREHVFCRFLIALLLNPRASMLSPHDMA